MNDIIKIIKSLEDLVILIDGVTETVKDEIKNQEDEFLGALRAAFSRFNSATSDFLSNKRYKWKRSWKCRKRIYEQKDFSSAPFLLIVVTTNIDLMALFQ